MENINCQNRTVYLETTLYIRINTIFVILSPFILNLYCILNHLWGTSKYFTPVLILSSSVLLIGISFLLFSPKCICDTSLWNYLIHCSSYVGILNFISIFLDAQYLLLHKTNIIYLFLLVIIYLYIFIHIYRQYYSPNFSKILDSCWYWFRRNEALAVVIAFTIITAIAWRYCPEESALGDLTLNLFAGFISSIITIAVIEKVIKHQKERDARPLREALYRDVQLFTSRLTSLWAEMYVESTVNQDTIPLNILFSPNLITKLYSTLDLEGTTNTVTKLNWFSYIEQQQKGLINRGNKICADYITIADPEIIHIIHYLINDSMFLGLLHIISDVRCVDIAKGIPRPTLLCCYLPEATQTDYDMILKLINWCHSEYESLHNAKEKAQYIFPVNDIVGRSNHQSPPSSIVSQEKYELMMSNFALYQNKSSN